MMKRTAHPAEPNALYLFFCRVRCLRCGDLEAYEELVRASSHPDPDIQMVADVFLDEIRTVEVRDVLPKTELIRASEWNLEPAV